MFKFCNPRYLARVGLKRVIKLLQADANAELLESIIIILLSDSKSKCVNKEIEKTEETALTLPGTSSSKEKDFDEIVIYNWLESFTELNRFDLIVRFFSKDLILDIIQTLNSSQEKAAGSVALKYQNTH